MAFLRRHVEEGHPVIATEAQLIDMARSALQEEILAKHGSLDAARPHVEAAVRSAMVRAARSLTSDQNGREQLLADVGSEPLDSLFLGRRD